MSDHRCSSGCREYDGLSRRNFLGYTAGALAAFAAPGWLPRVVLADSASTSRDALVSVFLRGGCDSLSMVVPFLEDNYYALRPNLAVPRPDSGSPNAATDLDGQFGFSPGMAPLTGAFTDGKLAVIHACGLPESTRSHFDAMHFMEVGQFDAPTSLISGWLGRHLATTAPTLEGGLLRAVGLGFGLQRTLVGGPQAIPVPDPANYGLAGDPATEDERRGALEAMYASVSDPLKTAALNTTRTIDLLEMIDFDGYVAAGDTPYPDGEIGMAFKSTAALLVAEIGVEAIALDVGGWDTHDDQEPLEGRMYQLMQGLSQSLAAFREDLEARGKKDVLTTVMSEFGRNVFENGSGGTDHGYGNLMLVLGENVDGGRVITDWPGLAPELLFEGQDLAVTLDYRDILTEIVTKRLGNTDYKNVFPEDGYTPMDRGVILGAT